MKKIKPMIVFLFWFIIFGLLSCSDKNPTAGNGTGTEAGNAIVSGFVCNNDRTPAVGATIRFVPVNYDPSATPRTAPAIDSVVTDNKGAFGLNTLKPGDYNLLAVSSNSSEQAFSDSIHITGDVIKLDTVSLNLPGSIRGVIKDDPKSVLMFAFGTFILLNNSGIDTNGYFVISNLAAGTYRMQFLSVLDKYLRLDTFLTVQAGNDFPLVDTIVLPLAIQVPKNIQTTYDTLHQIARITWSGVDTSLVKGYNIYRKNVDSNSVFAPINKTFLNDTVFVDSQLAPGTHYEYHVNALNPSGVEGTPSTVASVFVANAYVVIDSITLPFKARKIVVSEGGVLYAAGLDSIVIINGETKAVIGKFKSNDTIPVHIVDFAISEDGALFVVTDNGSEYHLYQCSARGIALKQWAIKNYFFMINEIGQIGVSRQGTFIMDKSRTIVYRYFPDQDSVSRIMSIYDYEYMVMGGREFNGFSVSDSGVVLGIACDSAGRSFTRLSIYYGISYRPETLFCFDRIGEIPPRITYIDASLAAVSNGVLWIQLQKNAALIRSGLLQGGLCGFGGRSLDRIYACEFDGSRVFVFGLQIKIPEVK